jgi:monovalent cation:H+ antiporter-2, CPA2 family
MPHHFIDLGLIIFIAAIAGIFMSWLRQLPMVGYVVAGILLGPAFLNVIQSEEQIRFVAELGVILLLFILGMELPWILSAKVTKPPFLSHSAS